MVSVIGVSCHWASFQVYCDYHTKNINTSNGYQGYGNHIGSVRLVIIWNKIYLIGGVKVTVLASSAVGHGFELW